MAFRSGSIDLHIHSTASDGSLDPGQILEYALKKGISAVSITDHDTVAGVEAVFCQGIPETLEFISGIEISAAFPTACENTGSLHILGYGIKTDHPELVRMLEKQRAARSGRNPRIIEKLNAMGIPVSIGAIAAETGKKDLARPHIADFLVKKGYAKDIDDAFDRLLGRGKPAYVDKYRISAEKAVGLIRAAGGVAVLAHPVLLIDPDNGELPYKPLESLLRTLKSYGLGGIEAYYPGQAPALTSYFEKTAEAHGLLVTGGTDFHGEINPDIEMGSGRGDLFVPYAVFKKLKSAVTSAQLCTAPETRGRPMTEKPLSNLEDRLYYRFSNRDLLKNALCHRSYAHEQSMETKDNERLEFLGDAVLNLVISHILMSRFPELKEGELSRIRASLVNENRLASVARSIELGEYVQLGKGESKSRGGKKKSILSDTFEALVAAVYLDGGYDRSFELIERHFAEHFNAIENTPPRYDYKSLLQELAQNRFDQVPVYNTIGAEGPDHDKTFHIALSVCGVRTEGIGKSKKAAEQEAAKKAFDILSQANDLPEPDSEAQPK